MLNSLIIKQLATDVGFDGCGISKAEVDTCNSDRFTAWIAAGLNADMDYLRRNMAVRFDPQRLVANAQSVISVILNYYPSTSYEFAGFTIAKYAYGRNYHFVMTEMLDELLSRLRFYAPNMEARRFVDSAPVAERYFAAKAGLGYIGRNTTLITPEFGSYVFVGEIITDLQLDYDAPLTGGQCCNGCSLCVDACPTHAITGKGLDARNCLSYNTIENRRGTPPLVKAKITTQVFGCDICQDVCPYNAHPRGTRCPDLALCNEIRNLRADELASLSNRGFAKKFADTSLVRSGRTKILENFNNLPKTDNSPTT